MEPQTFKVVLVGDGGVGKTAYINRLKTGEFERKYITTQGVDVVPLTFSTNYGKIIFKVWDCAGQEKFGGLRDGYWLNADAVMFMFCVDSGLTFNQLGNWVRDVGRVVKDKPAVIVGNKSDIKERKVTNDMIKNKLGDSVKNYYDISVLSNYNFEKPWLNLAKQLTGHADLEFVEDMYVEM